MVTRTEAPASIEGSELLVASLDIRPAGPPIKLAHIDETIFPLKAARRAESTITQEHNPKQWRFKESSMLNLDDSITGRSMWGFSSDPISPGDITRGGRGQSSSHTGQQLKISGTCFMALIHGWIGDAIQLHPRDEILQEE
jgi:hypothetical protein